MCFIIILYFQDSEQNRLRCQGGLDQGHPDGLILIVFVLGDTPTVWDHCNDRCAFIHLPVLTWLPIVLQYANITVLFFIGILLVPLFFLWQYYLEWSLDDTNLPCSCWTAPPLMKPSMWNHARGRFAAMQIIACVN